MTLCLRCRAAGRGLRRWTLRARLHRALPRPARIAPASDAWPSTSAHPRALPLVQPFAPYRQLLRPRLTSRSGSSPSPLQAQGEISPGKNALLRCTTAGSTPLRLDHKSFAVASPLALLGSAFYPILVHRLAAALHASSPHSVTLVQLRFASLAVINSWRDLHPQECARAGRTSRTAPEGPFASSGLVAGARYRSKQFV